MTSRYLLLAGTAGMAIALAAQPALAQKSKDLLRFGFYQPISMVDSIYDPRPEGSVLQRNVYDTLITFDADKKTYLPHLAQSWKRIDDKTIEFKLRQDIKFHNGSDMDADDVVYTFNFATNPKNKFRFKGSRFGWIASTEKIDKYTVRVRSKTVYAPFLSRMSNTPPVYPSDLHSKLEKAITFGHNPVGTGPYRVISVDKNKGVVLVKHDGYKHANEGKPAGQIGRIHVFPVPDRQVQVAKMLIGAQDIMYNVDKDQANSLAANPNFRVKVLPSVAFSYVTFDAAGRSSNKVFKDKRVRKALMLALDRKKLLRLVHDDIAGMPLQQAMCHSWHQGCSSTTKTTGYDLAEAKRLLAEAGLANGFETSILTWGPSRPVAEAVAGELRKIGVRAKVNSLPIVGFIKARAANKAEIMVTLWDNGVGQPDVDTTMGFFFLKGSRNYTHDDRLTNAVMAGRMELNLKKREAIYAKAFDLANTEHYFKPLIPLPAVIVHHKDVKLLGGHKNPKGFELNRISWN
jgi:peptide/nickel transport system substrate-binding protein